MRVRLLSLTGVALALPHLILGCGGEHSSTAKRSPTIDWDIQTVDTEGKRFWHIAMALDASSQAHIVYMGGNEPYNIRYATNKSGSWQVSKISKGVGSCDIAVDTNGDVHVAWVNGALRYAKRNKDSWSVETVDTNARGKTRPAIAVDRSAGIHLAYQAGKAGDLIYATRRDGSWEKQTVDAGPGKRDAGDVDLFLGDSGQPHIAYYDFPNRALKYAAKEQDTWETRSVGSVSDFLGGRPSLAILGHEVRILYGDQDGSALRLATYRKEIKELTGVGLKATAEAGGSKVETFASTMKTRLEHWVVEQLDHIGRDRTRMVMDASENMHVSFTRGGALVYGTTANGKWETVVVDPEGGGWYCWIAVDSSGHVHMAYMNRLTGALKYAKSQ